MISANAAESKRQSLRDARLNLKNFDSDQTLNYNWVTITEESGKRVVKDYATLVLTTKSERGNIVLHDTINVKMGPGMVFDRTLKFPGTNLLTPQFISLDVGSGTNSVRQFNYEKGVAISFSFSGHTNREAVSFDSGILTFNSLLRLAPLLPREIGQVYTFETYAEPFLFRTKQSKGNQDDLTLTCEKLETIQIGRKSYKCAKFRMHSKSGQVQTDVWVGNNNRVVKFADILPGGAEASSLEATLRE